VKRILLGALLAATVSGQVVAAKRDPVPATDPLAYNRDLLRNAEATREMADCIVKGRPEQAREAVANGYSLKQMRDKTPGVVRRGCMGADVPGMGYLWGVLYAGDLYLYAIAEAVIRHDKTLDRPVDFTNIPSLSHREPFVDEAKIKGPTAARLIEREHERETTQAFLSRYGECVARNATPQTAAVLRAETGSSEEKAAFAALQPFLGACLKGAAQIKMGKPALRGALALNYYRLAAAAGQTPIASGRP
jgi:hypothetical protein